MVLHAIISKDGSDPGTQYVSGPPLLMKSAMDAVKQWRYKPTMLNGEPVEVDTTIYVVFTLGQLRQDGSWSVARPRAGLERNRRPAKSKCRDRCSQELEELACLRIYVGSFNDVAANRQVGWDLVTMWHNMGIPAKSVVLILFVMSAWSVGIMIDRALMYSAARKQSRVFVQQVAGALKDNKLDEAISIAERNKKSHIAKVVATGLSEFQAASCAGQR